ncbi:hypothetical protein GCM10007939_23630 [Amylibacter marinus]|uniref:Uncharacterized protein n=1 Tax=Amylibacter marinus TaxID=1475483 RepID=A0ABQ5VY56_9RHOB|nr:hypothetical protein [Amylibacter marinus]GLQ36079.1 hypothetical protein GCM10007939_23630 [Amylibacter marinus]
MGLSNWFPQSPAAEVQSGTLQVGWMLTETKAGIVYYPPERVRSASMNKGHAKSASRCPAIIDMESRHFVVRVPFDLHLRFSRDKSGKPGLRNILGDKSPVRPSILNKVLHVTKESEWRYADKPSIQVSLPYLFIADEPTYMTQLDAFMHYRKTPLPGTIFGGRFPIDVWPRPLMWAFEWHDIQEDLILKRGDPWFYLKFETTPQNRPVSLVEATSTPELEAYLRHLSSAVNYVNQSFSLFKEAKKVRPAQLLVPKKHTK